MIAMCVALPSSDPTTAALVEARIDEARTLIEGRWEPVVVDGKRPVISGWGEGGCTVDRYRAELLQSGATNIGLRTGHVVGVDIDVFDKEHVAKLRARATEILGASGFVRFGKKGAMLVYRNATPIGKITVKAKGAGIEILGVGQQFVAFGAHPDTREQYEWEVAGLYDPLSAPVAELPEVKPEQLTAFARACAMLLTELGYADAKVSGGSTSTDGDTTPGKKTGLKAAAEYEVDSAQAVTLFIGHLKNDLKHNGEPVIGNFSDERTRDIAHAGRELGLSNETMGDLMTEHWAPPHFERAWINEKIANAERYGKNERGSRAPDTRSAEEVFAPYIEKAKAKAKANENASADDDMALLSGYDDWQGEPDTEWLIDGTIPLGATITINGKSQSFKSFILLDVLFSVATKTLVFGTRKVEITGGAVYIPVEAKKGAKKKRIEALRQDRNVIPRNLRIYEVVPQITRPEDIETLARNLRAFHKQVPIKAIGIDHAAGVLGSLSANDREALTPLWQLLNALKEEFNCTVFVAAHPPKSAAADEANVAGTYGFYADVEGFLQVSRPDGSDTAQIDIKKMKDEDVEGSQIFVKARRVGLGTDKKKRPVSSLVLGEVSAAALAHERDSDRATVELALERTGATSEAKAISTDDLSYAVARIGNPEFPAAQTAVSGLRADHLKAARALVRRVQDRKDTLGLRFKDGSGKTSPWKWRLLPNAERTVAPGHVEPPTQGTVPDRREGDL